MEYIELCSAVERFDHMEMERLLSIGVNPNTKGFENAPMHFAALNSDLKAFDILIKHGAIVDTYDYTSHTPLLMAVMDKWTQGVRFLLQRGARVHTSPGIPHNALNLVSPEMREILVNAKRIRSQHLLGLWRMHVRMRGAATYWQQVTQESLCAPDGEGRIMDRAQFEYDFAL